MTNRFCNPDDQYCDDTGLPYEGGFLYFFASGTDTPLSTYSNQALSIANSNPIELDSAGRPGSVFLQNLAYKVVLKDVDLNTIWTMDPVSTSDFTTQAQVITFAGNPNGSVAGTAGTGSIPSSMVWDRTNNVLYVATTTGSAATTVWTAVNPSNAANAVVPMPGGYLTPVSNTPIILSDATAITSIFYTPFRGNLCPIYNGSTFVVFTFSEQTLALAAQHAIAAGYDVFAFSNSGTFTVGTGPAWSNSTAGAGARGTGAGTTQLQLINGMYCNAVAMTVRNGATTYSVAANQATYLGSILIGGSAGQVNLYRSYGQNRTWGVWNYYNRQDIILKAGDSTASWVYTTDTFRAANGSSANTAHVFQGIAEEILDLRYQNSAQATFANTAIFSGIGVNSTTTASGLTGSSYPGTQTTKTPSAVYIAPPSLGLNSITCLEKSNVASGTCTFFGGEDDNLLTTRWRG